MTITGATAHVNVNAVLCQGHGRCYSLYPDLFEPDDLGLGSVTTNPMPTDDALGAAANCPESAVVVRCSD